MTVQRTNFGGRTPSNDELDDLILIELAIRRQANLDERRKPLPPKQSARAHAVNVRAMAISENWVIEPYVMDDAVKRLCSAGLIFADRDPNSPEPDGCSVRLQAVGYAKASAVSRSYLSGPLVSFKPDDEMFDGIGQVEVDFLGKRLVIGCVEGEEDNAIRRAHRFEVDTGEVLKAVTGDLDHERAMIMSGALAYERIEELESETQPIPASDRIVAIDHNRPDYREAVEALNELIRRVSESNSYRERNAADHERRLTELEAGRQLIKSRWVSVETVKAALWGTFAYLSTAFLDAPIGEAASIAWAALKRLLGLL